MFVLILSKRIEKKTKKQRDSRTSAANGFTVYNSLPQYLARVGPFCYSLLSDYILKPSEYHNKNSPPTPFIPPLIWRSNGAMASWLEYQWQWKWQWQTQRFLYLCDLLFFYHEQTIWQLSVDTDLATLWSGLMKDHGLQARASENFAGPVDFETPRPDLPVHFLNFQKPW